MKSHELAEKVARLQHDLCILSMSNLSEERIHEMLDEISEVVAVYAEEAEKHYPDEKDGFIHTPWMVMRQSKGKENEKNP